MFRRWFDPHARFDEDHDMAGRRRGPHHPRPPGPPPPPPGPWGGPPHWAGMFGGMFGRGPRARRGNVRAAILTLLAEQPHNGYQMMQAIEQRSHGTWKPSSGSIYPTLQQLEDEGLVETEEAKPGQAGSRTYKLTAKGKRYVDEHREELEAEWDAAGRGEPAGGQPRWEIAGIIQQVAAAAMQVAHSGTATQLDEAKRLLHEVRRNLYRILAELPPDEDGDDE